MVHLMKQVRLSFLILAALSKPTHKVIIRRYKEFMDFKVTSVVIHEYTYYVHKPT